jgi:sporulation protein YlmC with PRC-barrel domain
VLRQARAKLRRISAQRSMIMTKTGLLAAALTVALNLTLPALSRAQNTDADKDKSGQSQDQQASQAQAQAAPPRKISEQELKKKVTKINKASSFIGMKVQNLQNQDLGKVEDLAFDPESGKIAYAVLSVGGFLGMNDKYIAVPLKDLTPAPGEDHLIIDADKNSLQRAPGFAKNKWPDLDTPPWSPATGFANTRPQSTAQFASGTTGKSGQEQGSGGQQSDQAQSYSGSVTAVDSAQRLLTVKGDQGEKKFKVDDKAQIKAGQNDHADLHDLKVGSHVTIQYKGQGDQLTAESVRE